MADYQDFLAAKALEADPVGFEARSEHFPKAMKPFQSAITSWACGRGCAALFEGTGLGKTLQELTWADAVRRETRKPTLLLAPLAVAEQTVMEAEKFDVEGVAYP